MGIVVAVPPPTASFTTISAKKSIICEDAGRVRVALVAVPAAAVVTVVV
jgi:hypothetical protein